GSGRERGAGSGTRRCRNRHGYAALDSPENVLLRDATREAGSGDGRDVDLMLRSNLADQRRGLASQALLGRFSSVPALHGRGGSGGRGREGAGRGGGGRRGDGG